VLDTNPMSNLDPHGTRLDFVKPLGTPTSPRGYRNKPAIFTPGDKADALFYTRDSHLKLTVTSRAGRKLQSPFFTMGAFLKRNA